MMTRSTGGTEKGICKIILQNKANETYIHTGKLRHVILGHNYVAFFSRFIAFLSVRCPATQTVAFLPPYFLPVACSNVFTSSLAGTAHFPVGSEQHASK